MTARMLLQASIMWALWLPMAGVTALADPAAYLIRVPVPIVGAVDTHVMRSIDRIRSDAAKRAAGAERPILVLEFWPSDHGTDRAAGSFERSLALARYLTGPALDDIRTVAYVPRSLAGHAVLAVIGCEQIIMHPDAKLGPANVDKSPVSPTVLSAYREIATRRQTLPEAVALGMLDPKLTVYKVTTDAGIRFELESDLATVRERENVQAIDTLISAGQLGQFSGEQLRLELGAVSHLVNDRRELAAALHVQASLLEPDPSLGGEWRPIRVDLDGLITEKKVDSLIKVMEDHLSLGSVNFICITVNSPGGSPTASVHLAGWLADLDSSQVRTVAFVTRHARGDAVLIAAACDHIILQSGASLGGPGEFEFTADSLTSVRSAAADILRKKGRYWSLPIAMLDPALKVYRYQLDDSNVQEFWCEEEFRELGLPDRWRQGEVISDAGQYLTATAENADTFPMIQMVVDTMDDLRMAYQIEGPLTSVKSGWADEFVEFLASPQIAVTLLFFGGFALMAELSTPGIGAGGFVSAVCFVLYFWSQFLHGTATLLEILLFVTGLMCVAAEIFLIPGIGIFGFGGGLLIIAALVLASQTFIWPRNEYQMQQLPKSLLTVGAAAAGVFVGMIVLRRFLEKAPFLRHVMLQPPADQELDQLRKRELISDLSWAEGQSGVTVTPLMPSGKARILDRLVDVVTDGEPLDRGTPIEVVEVQAYRVLVRASSSPSNG